MPAPADETALDNPVWSCLTTRHADLAEGGPLARRYRAEFSPLCAMAAAAPENVDALLGLASARRSRSRVNRMLGAGQTPILHVESTNRRAIDLYLGLGFVRRTEFPLLHVRRMQ